VPIGCATALFLILAGVDHLLTATLGRRTYESDLAKGINRYRWVEYSLSATLMVILIAFYSGLSGITTVIAIAGANIGMILFGWIQELMNPPGRARTTMVPFWFGTLVGLAPWAAIAINVVGVRPFLASSTASWWHSSCSSSVSASTSGSSIAALADGLITPSERRDTWF
jgi:hypothetical protein